MKTKLRTPFSNLYIGIWIILFAIVTAIELIVSQDHILIKLLFIILSLSFYALVGFVIWQFVIFYSKTKNIILNFINYIIIGILTVIIWSLFNKLILIGIERFTDIAIFGSKSWVPQFFIGTFIYIVNILFFHVILLFIKYNEKSVSEEKLKNLLIETRLNELKAYINPHFLFNSLNSVNALIKSDPDKAREMLVNLSDYFRNTLKQKDNNFTTIEDEIENALLYLEIEKSRFGERIQIATKIDNDATKQLIPTTILQPLFENIIKHAISQTNETIFINFEISVKNHIEIILSNNYDEKYHTKISTGIGLSTIVERLNLIYNTENLVEIIKKDNNFKIILKLPINKIINEKI